MCPAAEVFVTPCPKDLTEAEVAHVAWSFLLAPQQVQAEDRAAHRSPSVLHCLLRGIRWLRRLPSSQM